MTIDELDYLRFRKAVDTCLLVELRADVAVREARAQRDAAKAALLTQYNLDPAMDYRCEDATCELIPVPNPGGQCG